MGQALSSASLTSQQYLYLTSTTSPHGTDSFDQFPSGLAPGLLKQNTANFKAGVGGLDLVEGERGISEIVEAGEHAEGNEFADGVVVGVEAVGDEDGMGGFECAYTGVTEELADCLGFWKSSGLELLKFREAGVEVVWKDIRKRWDRQSQAFYNLFRQADRVEKLAEIIQRLEQGDLKLRVRTLESERAFQRVATVQKTVGNVSSAGILASAIMHNAYLFGSCLSA
ncbi:uncharacterized protein LOC133730730 [Rosa rugosa]|uniref:uncharacterized protein LOC133730730 n=1 Tax=Rosa rugosa TaxID=74645 RepID=UPI002B417E04|nr:uncharacterized protein LOC133730730 [Rosa rugosa]